MVISVCQWVNIGSGNGFLPDGAKPLPEAMLLIIFQTIGNMQQLHFINGSISQLKYCTVIQYILIKNDEKYIYQNMIHMYISRKNNSTHLKSLSIQYISVLIAKLISDFMYMSVLQRY